MLRDRIVVCGVHSKIVKERLLRDNELTLIKALSIIVRMKSHRAGWKTNSRKNRPLLSNGIKTHSLWNRLQEINIHSKKTTGTGNQQAFWKQEYSGPNYISRSSFTCGKCGKDQSRWYCPAFRKRCVKYHWKNYFAAIFKT